MDSWNPDKITPFDRALSMESLLWMKLLIPYLPPDTQRMMAIYVRFSELQYTFSSFQGFRRTSHEPMDMFQEFRPFLRPSDCEAIDNLLNMLSMMEMMQEFQDTEGADFDPMSMMSGMFGSEQEEMFEMFRNLNTGGNVDAGLDE
ncbi:MAG: hypothetical protein UHS49_03225 [Faecalimonas sp.]|nr:hypothetical protein [Faecalimonas sp.]